MNKNLVLVQNGFPGSKTSGTEVDNLDIRNFFKFEKDVTASNYASREVKSYNTSDSTMESQVVPTQWYEKNGELKLNNKFKHYSVSFLLFAVRMKKGFLGTHVTITSRIPSGNPLQLSFYDIGETLQDFKNINNLVKYRSGDYSAVHPHKVLSNAIVIPTLTQYNHCFLAVLFSDSVYTKESGTALLTNDPLLNISWTETEFIEG